MLQRETISPVQPEPRVHADKSKSMRNSFGNFIDLRQKNNTIDEGCTHDGQKNSKHKQSGELTTYKGTSRLMSRTQNTTMNTTEQLSQVSQQKAGPSGRGDIFDEHEIESRFCNKENVDMQAESVGNFVKQRPTLKSFETQ